MAKELRDRELKDDHDVLWEELENQLEQIKNAYRTGRIKLNDVVIRKSALYLSIDRYINEVKDRTINDLESEISSYNRMRVPKSNFKKQLDHSAKALETSVNLNFANEDNTINYETTTIADKAQDEETKYQSFSHFVVPTKNKVTNSSVLHNLSKLIIFNY